VKRLAAIALALSSVFLVAPTAALASGSAATTAVFAHLGMHDGYRVTLVGTKSTAFLDVATPRGRQGVVTATRYFTRAELSGSTLKADFGTLGQVAMHFVPGGRRPTPTCLAAKRSFIRHGTFVGTFRFRGESDYVNFDVRRARGGTFASLRGSKCERAPTSSQGNGGTHQKLVKFYAGFRQGIDASYFWAETTSTGRAAY
jgi:hypothetical protein